MVFITTFRDDSNTGLLKYAVSFRVQYRSYNHGRAIDMLVW